MNKKLLITSLFVASLVFILMFGIGFPSIFTNKVDYQNPNYNFPIDNNYYIENYGVEITANKDRSFDIVEKIDVYFIQPSRGIVRDIPINNKEIIKNLKAKDDYFSINKSNDFISLKIGDSDKYITK